VTTFVAIIAKISILIMFLELIYYTSSSLLNLSWKNNLLLSSLLSLIIGSVLGLTQFRIKRLYAYSTISHLGFILLALTINSVESIQAFLFYLIQYSISNLNAFIILISIGYSFFYLIYKDNNLVKEKQLKDINYSPIQLISQLKGYFKINPMLSISLTITLFSFVGVPPLIGFFGKQMILSAALDNGYIFITLVAILTSVISAVYYLVVVKNIFFEENDQKINPNFNNLNTLVYIENENKKKVVYFNYNDIIISSSLSNIISIITIIILLFILIPKEWLNITSILSSIIFYY
jgi:NADH-ubiquinone oxidoreductase chain 2